MAVIECVPNISEGRRLDIVETIAAAVAGGPGVALLDWSSDGTHNRSVLTLAGDAPGLEQAVLRLFAATLPHIDLRSHRGAHPRIGAVDVVPFVPIRDVTMAECVALAKTVAHRVAERFDLPVFLYEEAAASADRRNLADIRRGGFEGLAGKMASGWAPDFGPATPHPTAGATVIGARPPLIAFNVNLATDRVDVAKAIAAAVRESSGGLPRVKALGLALPDRGLAQVSMNLTDYQTTSITRAFEAVHDEAQRRHITVAEREIVGLVPADALPPEPERTLQLAGFRSDQVLETRLQSVRMKT
jgi:glutamate formiminotransferase